MNARYQVRVERGGKCRFKRSFWNRYDAERWMFKRLGLMLSQVCPDEAVVFEACDGSETLTLRGAPPEV